MVLFGLTDVGGHVHHVCEQAHADAKVELQLSGCELVGAEVEVGVPVKVESRKDHRDQHAPVDERVTKQVNTGMLSIGQMGPSVDDTCFCCVCLSF